jgi:hypothetical protein
LAYAKPREWRGLMGSGGMKLPYLMYNQAKDIYRQLKQGKLPAAFC